MTKRQTTKGNIATKEQQGNSKRKTSDSSLSRLGNKETKVKMPVRVKAALKVSKKEIEEPLPAEFLKPIRNLSSIFTKIDKLEKERREILRVILKNNRLKKRIS